MHFDELSYKFLRKPHVCVNCKVIKADWAVSTHLPVKLLFQRQLISYRVCKKSWLDRKEPTVRVQSLIATGKRIQKKKKSCQMFWLVKILQLQVINFSPWAIKTQSCFLTSRGDKISATANYLFPPELKQVIYCCCKVIKHRNNKNLASWKKKIIPFHMFIRWDLLWAMYGKTELQLYWQKRKGCMYNIFLTLNWRFT